MDPFARVSQDFTSVSLAKGTSIVGAPLILRRYAPQDWRILTLPQPEE
jgi:hypothetical protein